MSLAYYSFFDVYRWISSTVKNIYRQFVVTSCDFFELDFNLVLYLCGIPLLLVMALLCCCKKCKIEIPVVIPLLSDTISEFAKALKSKGIITIDANPVSQKQLCVVLIHNSRLEANVANALAKFQEDQYRQLVLLIVHCVPKTELPRESSKSKLMQVEEYKNLADVIDIAYYENKGIYNCETNTEALGKLRDLFQN